MQHQFDDSHKGKPLLNTFAQCHPKDGTNEIVKSEERKVEETAEGPSKNLSKKVIEKEGEADLKVASHKSPLLKLDF